MLEGLLQLIWMANDPVNRAFRWRLFSYVHDWRVALERRNLGIKLDPDHLRKTKDSLIEHGVQFVSKKRQKAINLKKELNAWKDPFIKSWIGMPLSDLANDKDVQGAILYNSNYKFFSNIHHWDTGGFQSAIKRDENKISYLPPSPQELATSFATSFQCLFQTAVLANTEFELAHYDSLKDLRDRYTAVTNRVKPSDEIMESNK